MTKTMHTKIVGISFQKGIKELIESKGINESEVVLLYPEPTNPHDSNAIMVYTIKNFKLGYINRKYTKKVKSLMDKGVIVTVANITGGGEKSYGINIRLEDK